MANQDFQMGFAVTKMATSGPVQVGWATDTMASTSSSLPASASAKSVSQKSALIFVSAVPNGTASLCVEASHFMLCLWKHAEHTSARGADTAHFTVIPAKANDVLNTLRRAELQNAELRVFHDSSNDFQAGEGRVCSVL